MQDPGPAYSESAQCRPTATRLAENQDLRRHLENRRAGEDARVMIEGNRERRDEARPPTEYASPDTFPAQQQRAPRAGVSTGIPSFAGGVPGPYGAAASGHLA